MELQTVSKTAHFVSNYTGFSFPLNPKKYPSIEKKYNSAAGGNGVFYEVWTQVLPIILILNKNGFLGNNVSRLDIMRSRTPQQGVLS